jgi:hypothetical protein
MLCQDIFFYIFGQMPLVLFSRHKHCICSQF